ncbi:MAG: LuxR C-terminal-related transcriptional regulator [Acidimicrobiales bacterium]
MANRIATFVYANDPVSQAGISAQLRPRPEIQIVEEGDVDNAEVAVIVADDLDTDTARIIRAVQRNGCPRVVAVVTKLDDGGLFSALEAGACGLLRREEATTERLVQVVQSAAQGDGSVPPDLLGRLLNQIGKLQRQVLAPRGITMSGLTEREIEVLRLVAEGWDTAEIAGRLSYSERTIKNIIHDITARLCLRNRTHAVAYAVREGLI